VLYMIDPRRVSDVVPRRLLVFILPVFGAFASASPRPTAKARRSDQPVPRRGRRSSRRRAASRSSSKLEASISKLVHDICPCSSTTGQGGDRERFLGSHGGSRRRWRGALAAPRRPPVDPADLPARGRVGGRGRSHCRAVRLDVPSEMKTARHRALPVISDGRGPRRSPSTEPSVWSRSAPPTRARRDPGAGVSAARRGTSGELLTARDRPRGDGAAAPPPVLLKARPAAGASSPTPTPTARRVVS